MRVKVRLSVPKKQHAYYSGKQHTHTQKFQILIDQHDGRIVHTAMATSNEHDLTLARQHPTAFPDGCLVLADLGYVGLELAGCEVLLPFKKHPKRELEPEQKAFNQRLAHFRVRVEHVIRTLKIFRILKERYRNRRQRFERRLNLIAALTNRILATP